MYGAPPVRKEQVPGFVSGLSAMEASVKAESLEHETKSSYNVKHISKL